ncbi:hypothetical protein I3843_07G038400 [Carya illinoinensis]|nr:hypothetical protein I3843_07G038400 [Carya illinoinensis]
MASLMERKVWMSTFNKKRRKHDRLSLRLKRNTVKMLQGMVMFGPLQSVGHTLQAWHWFGGMKLSNIRKKR